MLWIHIHDCLHVGWAIEEEPEIHATVIYGIPQDVYSQEGTEFPRSTSVGTACHQERQHDSSNGRPSELSLPVLGIPLLLFQEYSLVLARALLPDELRPEIVGVTQVEQHESMV